MHITRLKDNVNEWFPFARNGTGPADKSKKTKRLQGWSHQNWLGGILIIVSLYIWPQFNKLLMPFFARMLRYQLDARFCKHLLRKRLIAFLRPVVFEKI